MRTAMSIIFVVLFCLNVSAQTRGFYQTFSDPEGKTWRVNDVIETENSYLLMLRENSNPKKESKLMALSLEGEILGETRIAATDTAVNVCRLFLPLGDNNHVVGIGFCTSPDDNVLLLMLGFDVELNVVSRSMTPLPFPDNSDYYLEDHRFLQVVDGGYFAVFTFSGLPSQRIIILCKISNEGQIVEFVELEDPSIYYVASLFHVHDCPNGVGVFAAKQIPAEHVTSCALVYDDSLRLKKNYNITNIYEDDGIGHVYGGDIKASNSMMIASHNEGYFISSRLYEYTTSTNDQASFLAKTDSSFVIQSQYCIIGHFNDTIEAPAFFKSVDVNGEGMVFQCSMQNLNYGSWPYGSNGTHLVVTKTDADLNVSWQKRFLKDGNIYSAFQTIATSDGGCLIVGNVYDHNSELIQDLFVLKINEDGMVGIDEIEEESVVFVYPNPANGLIRIGGVEARETQVFDIWGQCVMSFYGNEASVEVLTAGGYIFRITDKENVPRTVRFVRK